MKPELTKWQLVILSILLCAFITLLGWGVCWLIGNVDW